ncbi:O-succinylbenzoic acid--CoA ligase [Pontibacillus halophilus JSM 076056 = DSM 19796]|uniref:2-succinylbenzoate--CoA ligase n=1 Tax=Pontibacillus halophilus JSM 076056 = DSM 19796 TaxID=1385510 RepID=A0A0A5I106_9BACI|nr:o-succinylbenzoate--CoA ligase [Pontibacillus halophilus]KGX89512.1 O-succinylbenzoic acid--CoA ligase [Pontibacillus halophilus JSM 076056 = DSM 19796]
MTTTDTIPHWLTKRAHLTPNRVAIVFEGDEITFQQLKEKSLEKAYLLASLGVREGSHVAVLSQNSLEFTYILHGLTYLGAIAVPLNTRLTKQEISYQINDAECLHFIYEDSFKEFAERVKQDCLIVRSASFAQLNELEPLKHGTKEELKLQDTSTIIYTSGTTGFPKGVVLTYGNHWWSAIGSALNLGIGERDKWSASLPLFHVGGLAILVRSLVYGMTVHLHRKFDAEEVHHEIMHKGVTMVSVVSVMLDKLLTLQGEDRYPDSFRCMLLGGGPAPRPLLQRAKERHVPVFQTYGMTETASQIVTLSAEDTLRKLGSAGKPLFQAQIKIVSDEREAAPEEVGEIHVKGPSVTSGYFKQWQANNDKFQDGWLATGDLGYLDEDGYLYVLDRRSDLIISGGENVYPAEIESTLNAHPAVRESGVIGVPHEEWGQVPVAFIVVDQVITEEELLEFSIERLAKYKVPHAIHTIQSLPRNASNKLVRRELVHLWEERK